MNCEKTKSAVSLVQQDLQPLHQETDLGRGLVGPVRQEARRKTDLAELENRRQRDELRLAGGLGAVGLVDRGADLSDRLLVERLLPLGQIEEHLALDFRRQVMENLCLRPAQDEGPGPAK